MTMLHKQNICNSRKWKKCHSDNSLGFDNSSSAFGHRQNSLLMLVEVKELTLLWLQSVLLTCSLTEIQTSGIWFLCTSSYMSSFGTLAWLNSQAVTPTLKTERYPKKVPMVKWGSRAPRVSPALLLECLLASPWTSCFVFMPLDQTLVWPYKNYEFLKCHISLKKKVAALLCV